MDQTKKLIQKNNTYRNICFTLNNYSDQEYEQISKIDIIANKIRYIIVAKEIGESGTPHLQGYIEYNTTIRMSGIKKQISNRIHIEERKGTSEQALMYCKKDGNFIEQGEPKLTKNKLTDKAGDQGRRQDLLNIWQSIKQGFSQSELLETYPIEYAKYGKAIDKYYTINEPARDRNSETQVFWYYGATGTGKSKQVYDENNDQVFTPKNFKWWDGYDRHRVVLLDDVRADYCKFHEWLTLTDRYQYKVEVKGGMRQLVANKIYITAPCHPRDMFKNKTIEDIQQLIRRITIVKDFTPKIKATLQKDIQEDIEYNLIDTVKNTDKRLTSITQSVLDSDNDIYINNTLQYNNISDIDSIDTDTFSDTIPSKQTIQKFGVDNDMYFKIGGNQVSEAYTIQDIILHHRQIMNNDFKETRHSKKAKQIQAIYNSTLFKRYYTKYYT